MPELPPSLRAELDAVAPSIDGSMPYHPCAVDLNDGSRLDAVYLSEARTYYQHWGVTPWADRGKRWVAVESISSISESPVRLPVEIANRIYAGEESGMGYFVFELVLGDGRTLKCQTGNAVDFVALPSGVVAADITDVRLHSDSARQGADCGSLPYAWALFRDSTTEPDRPI